MNEKKKFQSVPAHWQAIILTPANKKLIGKTKSLSLNGLLFESPEFIHVGEVVKLHLHGYESGEKIELQMAVEATYWALAPGGSFDVGAKYVSMTEKSKENLLKYIKNKC